ncbi:hypothetical protein DI53_0176 [Sphingobacterium deserti]|uniref:Uncharacterized protein n=1 Tax=Sphingobacterium deserti TaxID=1229276 RepID=A0A0B8T410_9SPHI|nr:hypothetical protein DI53_0176 [Sphingobacterium deserti]
MQAAEVLLNKAIALNFCDEGGRQRASPLLRLSGNYKSD